MLEFARLCRDNAVGDEARKKSGSNNDDDDDDGAARKLLEALAQLMNESHRSCRDLYECSCEALDVTVEKCLKVMKLWVSGNSITVGCQINITLES